jgi:hypothetical protein
MTRASLFPLVGANSKPHIVILYDRDALHAWHAIPLKCSWCSYNSVLEYQRGFRPDLRSNKSWQPSRQMHDGKAVSQGQDQCKH